MPDKCVGCGESLPPWFEDKYCGWCKNLERAAIKREERKSLVRHRRTEVDVIQDVDEIFATSRRKMVPSTPKRHEDYEIGHALYTHPNRPTEAPYLTMCQIYLKEWPIIIIRAGDELNFMRFKQVPTSGFHRIAGSTLERFQLLSNGLFINAESYAVKHQDPISAGGIVEIAKRNEEGFLDPNRWIKAMFRKLAVLVLPILKTNEDFAIRQLGGITLAIPYDEPS